MDGGLEMHLSAREEVQTLCVYCRGPLAAATAVTCARPRCGARYHAPCWRECRVRYGSCAVFRCGSTGLQRETDLLAAIARLLPTAASIVALFAMLAVLACLVWFIFTTLGGGPRYRQIDRLENPASISTWTTTGFLLLDGRSVRLPGVSAITGSPRALATLVKSGVEIGQDGRVTVLVRIYSGCGTCNSFKERRWKYDLSALLLVLGLASPDATIRPPLDAYSANRATSELEETLGWEWGLRMLGGPVHALETFCRLNEIPLFKHAPREFAGYW
jgi:hypothetical protein